MNALAHIWEEALLAPCRVPCIARLLTHWGDLLLDAVLGPFEGF